MNVTPTPAEMDMPAKRFDHGRYINYFIVAYAFVLPISKAGTTLFEFLMLFTWLAQGEFRHKYLLLRESRFLIALFSLVLLSVLAFFWSPNTSFWLEFVRKYHHFLIIPVIYTTLRPEYLRHVLSAFLLGMLFSEIVSYGLFFEFWTYKNIAPDDPSPFMDHTNYSIYLVLTAMILLNRVFLETNLHMRVIYLVFFTTVTANLFINAGRTGQIAFIVTLIIVGTLNIKHKFRAIAIMATFGCAILVAAYNTSPVFQERANQTGSDVYHMVQHQDFTGSLSRRVSLWVMGFHVFAENPLLGAGIGNETTGVSKYVDKYNFTAYKYVEDNDYIDYHSAFVQYAAQLGIIGLTLFLLVFVFLFKLPIRSTEYANLKIIFIITYGILSLVGFSFHIMSSMVLFALFSGVLSAIARTDTSPPNLVVQR